MFSRQLPLRRPVMTEDTRNEIRRSTIASVSQLETVQKWLELHNPAYRTDAFKTQMLEIICQLSNSDIDVSRATDKDPPLEHTGINGTLYDDFSTVVRHYCTTLLK